MGNVSLEAVSDPTGLEIRDRVNKRQVRLETSTEPTIEPAETELSQYPVESACRLETDRLRVPSLATVNVRESGGEQVTRHTPQGRKSLPKATYVLEVDMWVKIYLQVESGLEIESRNRETEGESVDQWVELSFDSRTDVVVGARARIDRPPTTVTTSRNLDEIRVAIESLSSSLQTTSPERSFPTLRGHPPRMELGSVLSIPSEAEPPDTGITLIVQRDLSSLFQGATLAYYLGAELEFGDGPALRTSTGFEFDVGAVGVDRVLKHLFLLDCLVRTHGLYEQKHREYESLVPEIDLDMGTLYDVPPNDRLESYLSVPTSVTRPHIPQWPSAAYVEAATESITAIPYLVDNLSLIRTDGVEHYRGPDARRVALSRFVADSTDTRAASAVFEGSEAFVEVPSTTACHEVWVGEGIPLGAHAFVEAGYENMVGREPADEKRLSVTVICNDPEMSAEVSGVRSDQYDDEGFEVEIHDRLESHELAEILSDPVDFLHFIGHAEEDGLRCPDGVLDVSTLPTVGVDSFLLNACQSYQPGISLVGGGAIGGVVTLGDIPNDSAITTGVTMARLLEYGFSIRNALTVVRMRSIVGGQYTLVGSGDISLNRSELFNDGTIRLDSMETGYEMWLDHLPNEVSGIGTQGEIETPEGWELRLMGGEMGPYETTADWVLDYLDLVSEPVWIDGEFHWSDEVTRADLKD